jgi:prepilin signal peptidase PulO-like enzyme (type II secretory pathway)
MLFPVHSLLPAGTRSIIAPFAPHIILFTFLLAATLTDFYEMVIPDTITVVGTITALCIAILFPLTALPVTELQWTDDFFPVVVPGSCNMHLWSPNPVGTYSMLAAIALWWFWCFAMLDRVWYTKLPFRKAGAIFWRYLYRSLRTKYYLAAALLVPLCLRCMNLTSSDIPEVTPLVKEISLLSALTGMFVGMILIWSVRLVSQYILGIEAMGFGDVTLMGMIGAFLGWQAVLLIFFLAPFFGLVYGIVHWALGRGKAVPYGPFLCLATVVVVIAWRPIWSAAAEYFAFGIGVIGAALFGFLFVFAGLLHVVHKIMSPK